MKRRARNGAVAVAGLYLVFAVVWIVFSDRAVAMLTDVSSHTILIQTAKGLLFVSASSALILVLVYHTLYRQTVAEAEQSDLQRRLSEVLNTVNDGVWEHDVTAGTLRWMGQWGALTGYSVDKFQTSEAFYELLHPDDRQPAADAYAAMLEGRAETFEVEHRLRAADGRWLWVRAQGRVVERDAQGKAVLSMGILTDITNLKDAGVRLSAMVETLTRSEAELERYAHATVHDLRQPIRQMVSYAQLLARGGATLTPAQMQDFGQYLREGAERLSSLLDGLQLSFEQRSRHAEFAPVVLDDVVGAAVAKLQAEISRTGAVVHADALPDVHGDAVQLALLFEHLIGNALKFRSPDRAPDIRVTADVAGEAVRVTVADNGIGFPPDEAEHLFQAFHRLHAPHLYPGVGMGLALCRSITQHHGGAITAHATDGEGARFIVTLPLTDGPSCPVGADEGAAL